MKSFGSVVGRESGSGVNMVFMFYLKKKRIGRRRNCGIEIMIVRGIEMIGIEVGIVVDWSEMEG